jgi:hypothetical protein
VRMGGASCSKSRCAASATPSSPPMSEATSPI